jgi:short-subunit dehydrogenase
VFVLITGAAGGLGRAFAVECAKRGYDLYLTDINDTGLALLKSGITGAYPVRVLTRGCDLTKGDEVEALFDDVRQYGITFDMLLNVAGGDLEGGFYDRGADNLVKIVQVNVETALRVTRQVLDHRTPNGPLYVVFVSSLASFYPMPLKATYAASKTFLREFACALRQELRGQGVKILTLCPGGLMTTPEAASGIAAQGFWGDMTTNPLERMTRRTIARVLKGRSLYVPGFVNRLFRFAGALVPKPVVARLLHARWQSAQKEWLKV